MSRLWIAQNDAEASFEATVGNEPVVILEFCHPYDEMLEIIGDRNDVGIVDVVSYAAGRVPEQKDSRFSFLQGPTMLELAIMRLEQLSKRTGANRIYVNDVEKLVATSGGKVASAFLSFLGLRAGQLNWHATVLFSTDRGEEFLRKQSKIIQVGT